MAASASVVNRLADGYDVAVMAVRSVVIWPDPRLTQPSQAVVAVDDAVRALYRDLADTMVAESGVGIAALQIGDPSRMFLLEARLNGGADDDPPLCFLNPEIVEVSDELQDSEEGCLSFPEVYIKVERPFRAKVRAMNLDGEMFEVEGEGLLARAILHENDHLTGRLLADFMGPLKRQMVKKKLLKVKANREYDSEFDDEPGGMRAPRLR